MTGRILRIFLAFVLVGVLAFLYVMSQGGDLKRQTQIVADLRNLKEIDTRWNRDAAAARSDMNAEPQPREAATLEHVLDDLSSETEALGNRALSTGVEGLRGSFREKQRLLEQFDQANAQLRTTLKDLLGQLNAIRQTVVRLGESDPGQRSRLSTLDGQLVALNSELLRLYVQPDSAARKGVTAATTTLVQSANQYPEVLRTPLSGLALPVALALNQEPAATLLTQQLALLPTSPRISSMNSAYDNEFQAIADQKEQFRVYLVFYSAALLVFLGYVAWQLGQSNVKINQANEALKMANESLEQKVQGRTKELSEALKHLKESEMMLVQTEKMSSLGQMVAGIAHEINTPLAYVKASLASVKERLPHVQGIVTECRKLMGLLERGDVPDQELSAQFSTVSTLVATFEADTASDLLHLTDDGIHGIDEIAEIVLNLKNFSRLDRSKLQRFNLNEGLESTLIIARNMVKHKTVHKQLREIPLVECSPSQINQVFLNLVTNAAQATTDDVSGKLTVATSVTEAGQVRVDVSDNGHGIPADILSKIFDPFFTTKDVGQGTGLGLSIAYKIVQEHGGRIEVRSKVGQGTMFSVYLPTKATRPQALAA
jgi:two-component system NtrC family sensor kinase